MNKFAYCFYWYFAVFESGLCHFLAVRREFVEKVKFILIRNMLLRGLQLEYAP